MASQPSEKPRGLPNPYAAKGLPNPYALATVAESAPVKFSEEQAKAEQKKTPAFHNPHHIKRPQAKGATVKKPAISRPVMSLAPSDPVAAAAPSQQPSLDWWRSTADDDAAALDYKRQVNREQKEKKKQERKFARQFGWWKGEAPYKADKPSNLKAYKASGGYRYKLESFDNFLRSQAGPSRSRRSDSERTKDSRPASSESEQAPEPAPKSRFAPPTRYDQESTSTPPALVQDDQSGEDAYARRARLAQAAVPSLPPQPPSEPQASYPPPPPASEFYAAVPPPPPPPETSDAIPPPPPPSSASYDPTISAPPVRYNPTISAPPVRYSGATISAPPVRYDGPNVQMNDNVDKPSPDERPAKRPRISKAEAMMAKMGYVKGQGLGKNSDGITTHLEVKARKNDRRVDISDHNDENGKNIKSQQVFDILGGRITKRKEPDRFGEESKVVVAWGCVDGIDWGADVDRDDGGIRQELGQTFDNKFGRVERVYVNLSGDQQPVYIKFASELSALNAVNRFHEGYQFRGRDIRALYYNEAKFEASVFDH